jgi:2-dehydropantoate 2-reductase
MRFVVYGAGGVGGVIGGRLAEHGYDVALIGRGKQLIAVREHGLRLESPAGSTILGLPIVENPGKLQWSADDVVLLTMKTQDTSAALCDLAAVAPKSVPVVCVQNGVENERLALRWFEHVYGICVMCPTGYLTPGVVQVWSFPVTGLLDIGRYPSGIDDTAKAIAGALSTSTFYSEVRPDIMRWKYRKLLMNLGNAYEALCGLSARSGSVTALARQEGVACLNAAGIDCVSETEDKNRRGDHLRIGTIAGQKRHGGSSWQSLQRQTRNIECDYLNGEIVLLGRWHGIPTPVNVVLQRLANQFAADGRPPGSMSVEEVLSHLTPYLRTPEDLTDEL